jgi:hypothetical protein
VPSSFKLLNHQVRVKENAALNTNDLAGMAEYDANVIHLATGHMDSVTSHTFHHELVHFLFYYAGRPDLAQDEALVDIVGGLLAQYEATKRP